MSKTLFDHICAIYQNQKISYYDNLTESDKKTYSTYMVNRFVSMSPDFIELANEMNKYGSIIDNRTSYLFYSQIIPTGRYFFKYIKASKEEPADPEIVSLIANHFEISLKEASEYLTIYKFTENGKSDLEELCLMYGIETTKKKRKSNNGKTKTAATRKKH